MTSPQNTNMQSFSNQTCWERWLVVDNQETVDKWQMPADDFEEQMGRILDVTCRAEFWLPNNISRKRLSNLFRPNVLMGNVRDGIIMERQSTARLQGKKKKPQDDANNNHSPKKSCYQKRMLIQPSLLPPGHGYRLKKDSLNSLWDDHTFIKRAKIRCGPLEKPSMHGHERMKNDAYLHAH